MRTTDAQLATLAGHFDQVLQANARFNLTRITDPAAAAALLYADSAAAIAWANSTGVPVERVLDIGTGAGFPALPLAVLCPDWQVTALETTGKKAAFVQQAAGNLGIANLQVVHAHSDHWPGRAEFDLVTLKALGSLETCLKTAARFVVREGHVAVYKTASLSAKEVGTGLRAAKRLGFAVPTVFEYELPTPGGPARFALQVYRRTGPTAKQ